MNDYSVKFNSNELKDIPGVWLYNYTATDLPERDIKIHKLARRSLSIVTSAEYTQKTIPVLMRVCSGSRQDTEETITNIKGLLQPQNGSLEVLQSNQVVRYTATMNEFNIEWVGSSAYVQILFLASAPIASSKEVSVLGVLTTTAPSDGVSFVVEGSYITEPHITIQLTDVTGGGSMSIFNASTNQGITLTENFSDGDVIEIDSSNLVVTRNGANIDFSGAFPVFPPGSQRLGYTDTFDSRTVTVTAEAATRIV